MDKRAAELQALLFAEGGALTFKAMAKYLGCTENELEPALEELSEYLKESGLAMVRSDTEASLVVSSVAHAAVTKKLNEEYERDIGEAGLEVLAILLYEGPSTRADIDYVRGVNSSSTLRNLLARGLIERSGNPDDGREYIYRATVETLAHLGVERRESLPEYDMISRELAAFKATANHGSEPGGVKK